MSGQQQPANPSDRLYQHLDIKLTLRAAKMGVWELDGPTGLVNWDDQCRNLFGFASDNQVAYDAAAGCIHPDDMPWVNKAIEATLSRQDGNIYDVTYRINRADNQELRWIRSVGEAYFTPAGELIRFIGVNQDVTEQHAVARSEAQLRAIIDSSPMPLCLFMGPDMVISTINQPFIDALGKGPDIVGKPLADVMPELNEQPFLTLLNDVRTSQQPFHGSAMPVRVIRQGVAYDEFYNVSYKPLLDEQNQAYAVLGIAVDVTHLQRQQQLLEQLVQQRTQELIASNDELTATNDELEEANNLLLRSNENLQTFAYVASHDLQEPLRKIQQFGDLLKENLIDSASNDVLLYLDRMQVAASRMSMLIKDLLNFSRITTQRSPGGSVSLQKLVGQVLDVLDLTISEKQAQVQLDSLPTVPGDAVQLSQLFQNLLSNALKFQRTDPTTGSPIPPRIRISAQSLTADELPAMNKSIRRTSTYCRIDVSDNGIGFDEKYLDRIFQVFQRLHSKNEFAGTGVGLAICEKVVTNHGGAITARSQLGQGTTFTIYLPADLG